MKSVLMLAALLLFAGCSTRSTDPMALRHNAAGTPDHDPDGGGDQGGGPPPMTFDASASGSTVSVSLDNFNASGAFGYQFTFTLSGGLALNPNLSGVAKGSWLSAGSIFSATTNPDGSVTVVGARLVGQGECAHAGGVLATIATTGHGTFTLVGSPSGAVTPSPDLQDCSNSPLSVSYGTASVGL